MTPTPSPITTLLAPPISIPMPPSPLSGGWLCGLAGDLPHAIQDLKPALGQTICVAPEAVVRVAVGVGASHIVVARERRAAALDAVAMIPEQASVAADTPLLPLLAQREVVIRFPKHIRYRDRDGETKSVDWVVAFPGFYSPLAPVFDLEHNKQRSIRRELKKLTESGLYQLIDCRAGTVVLKRQSDLDGADAIRAGSSGTCPWIE